MMRDSRKTLAALSIALLLGWAMPVSAKMRVGDRAADFVKVVDGKGRRVTLKQHKDKVIVLTFGASWCAPCKKELPALEKLAARYDSKKVVFLAVNIDTEATKGKQFMKQAGLRRVQALFDPQKSTVESYDPPKMPSLFVISRGIVKHVHEGYRTGEESDIAKAIDRQLR